MAQDTFLRVKAYFFINRYMNQKNILKATHSDIFKPPY